MAKFYEKSEQQVFKQLCHLKIPCSLDPEVLDCNSPSYSLQPRSSDNTIKPHSKVPTATPHQKNVNSL